MLEIITIASIALTILLGIWIFILERRLRKLFAGQKAKSLEGVIGVLGENIRALEKFQSDTTNYLSEADKRIARSVQGVETIRFNAFKGTGEGGNQSFAIALLSENGDGTVLSSLYSRDHVNVFAKPIKNFASEYEMTPEERDAVARAKRT
jgi:hypothetical protein